jgi:hypothetical protein
VCRLDSSDIMALRILIFGAALPKKELMIL